MRFGNVITGVAVSDTKFVGMTSINELEAFGLKRPSTIEDATQKNMKGDRPLQMAHELRDEVQRKFVGRRCINALAYARYIEQVEAPNGRPGGTPPITLWCQRAEMSSEGLVIPYGHPIVAIDGETQTEARFILRDENDFAKPETGNNPIAVVVFFSVDEIYARQILHDFNAYAARWSEKHLAPQNEFGPVTSASVAVCELAEIPLETVNRFGDKPNKKQAISQNQIAFAVMGYASKETSLVKNMGDMLGTLNNATTTSPINGSTVTDLAPMVKFAIQSQDARKASLPVWQIAGMLIQQGRGPESLNWAAANMASKGKGKVSKSRLQKIADSM